VQKKNNKSRLDSKFNFYAVDQKKGRAGLCIFLKGSEAEIAPSETERSGEEETH